MKYKIYGENIEQEALNQFHEALKQPGTVQGALMPDAHTGYTLPIGGVVATDGLVYPAFVGYDIGCGVLGLPTTFKKEDIHEWRKEIFEDLYKGIPTGKATHSRPQRSSLNRTDLTKRSREAFDKRKGFKQLGSLGGGNHFLEIGYDKEDHIWIIIHSGSRGPGHGIATEYMKLASGTDKAKEGFYPLKADSPEGKDYINDLNWCLQFALENRRSMVHMAVQLIQKLCDGDAMWDYLINRNHNHAEVKDGVWIHRKGATHAEKGMLGVIPGNMRDGCYIVQGKGCTDSLCSSSHGAGRVMSRTKAKQNIDLEDFKSQMSHVTARVEQSTIDEAPDAYKNIENVMKLQEDLVEVLNVVKPMINIKG